MSELQILENLVDNMKHQKATYERDQETRDLYQAALEQENIELKEHIFSLQEIIKTNEIQIIATENHFNAVIDTKDICIRELKRKLAQCGGDGVFPPRGGGSGVSGVVGVRDRLEL